MKPDFLRWVELRAHWRELHRAGDREGIEALLEENSMTPSIGPKRMNPLLYRKLEQFGREWELKIAELACLENALFFSLPVSSAIDQAGSVHQKMEVILQIPRPWGALLFCEAANDHPTEGALWQGIYYFAILPHRKPEDLQLESIPGVKTVGTTTFYETH